GLWPGGPRFRPRGIFLPLAPSRCSVAPAGQHPSPARYTVHGARSLAHRVRSAVLLILLHPLRRRRAHFVRQRPATPHGPVPPLVRPEHVSAESRSGRARELGDQPAAPQSAARLLLALHG